MNLGSVDATNGRFSAEPETKRKILGYAFRYVKYDIKKNLHLGNQILP